MSKKTLEMIDNLTRMSSIVLIISFAAAIWLSPLEVYQKFLVYGILWFTIMMGLIIAHDCHVTSERVEKETKEEMRKEIMKKMRRKRCRKKK